MLARPGIKSMTARFPWATFGFGPVVMLALCVAGALFIQGGLILWSPAVPKWAVPWGKLSFNALNWLATFAAPLLIAAVLVAVGIRQRITTGWIMLGLATICVIGAFHEIGIKWSTMPSQPSELYVGFAFAPPFPRNMILTGLLRCMINVVVVSGFYLLWRRLHPSAAAGPDDL